MFSSVFLLALAISSGIRAWLALRQYRHVAAHRGVVPFEFAASVPLADHRKAADYTQAKIRLAMVSLAIEIVLLLALTLGGLLHRLDEAWFALLGDRGHGHGLALFASVGVISFCVDLPFALYRTFVLEARFGFNKMTWRTAMADILKQAVLAVLIGAPLLLAVLWLMSAMGERWWWYVWLFWLAFNLLVMLIYPTLIAPLFNKFAPLPDGDLKERIGRLLERCGFTASGLFVMDGSKRSAHGNAYFTGLGRAKRIVFYDTLIDKLKPAEVEAVLAHELGHFKRRHIWKRIAVMAAISLVLLWSLGQLEADSYAASHANAEDLVTALVSLYRDNAATLTPDPIHSLFYDSHPPASLRIAHLRGY